MKDDGAAGASHPANLDVTRGRRAPERVTRISEEQIYANLARIREERPSFFDVVGRRLSDEFRDAYRSLRSVFANRSPREDEYFYGLTMGRRSLGERIVTFLSRDGHSARADYDDAGARASWHDAAIPSKRRQRSDAGILADAKGSVDTLVDAGAGALVPGVSSGLELVIAPRDVSDAYITDEDHGVFIARERDRAHLLAHLYKERSGEVAGSYAASKLEGRTLYGGAKAAVEGKRQRLETFAEIYEGLGGTEQGVRESVRAEARAKAAAAVGITSDRTIADYVLRVENGGRDPSDER